MNLVVIEALAERYGLDSSYIVKAIETRLQPISSTGESQSGRYSIFLLPVVTLSTRPGNPLNDRKVQEYAAYLKENRLWKERADTDIPMLQVAFDAKHALQSRDVWAYVSNGNHRIAAMKLARRDYFPIGIKFNHSADPAPGTVWERWYGSYLDKRFYARQEDKKALMSVGYAGKQLKRVPQYPDDRILRLDALNIVAEYEKLDNNIIGNRFQIREVPLEYNCNMCGKRATRMCQTCQKAFMCQSHETTHTVCLLEK